MKPTPKDPRDKHFHFHRLFGSLSNLHLDNGIFPDQNADNRPDECTAYTVIGLASQKTGKAYSKDYQYMRTLQAMGASPDSQGADARTGFKVATSEGLLSLSLQPVGMSNMTQAWAANSGNWSNSLINQTEKQPAYSPVSNGSQDWFDSIRNVLGQGYTVGMATQWSDSFEGHPRNSILPDKPSELHWGHMYEAVDVHTIKQVPYLVLKTWQGPGYGYCYMSRALCNKLMGAWGTYAAAFVPLSDAEELKQRSVSLLEVLIALLQNLSLGFLYKVGFIK
jgi:hypothetical protein